MNSTTIVEKLESALDELQISYAGAACSSVEIMAANPEHLEWWLTGLMYRLKAAIANIESAVSNAY